MTLLERIEIDYQGQKKYIELYQGDLTNLGKNEYFDLLVLSAFPNDYSPTPTSLIGALYKKGLSVAELASLKELDLLDTHACWFSRQINHKDYNGIEFKRILCYEPFVKGLPPYETIGDIFQALMPITMQYGIKSVGMPLLTTGDANYPVTLILNPLIEAAINWMNLGLGLDVIKIVAYDANKAKEALEVFQVLKLKYSNYFIQFSNKFEYDYFISYAHEDFNKANFLLQKIKEFKPESKVFFDRDGKTLQPGHAWQIKIFEALDNCAKIIVLLSHNYITSKFCKEEFNIAHFRQRESDDQQILLPIYLFSCKLPTYMKLIQHIDCTEGIESKLEKAVLEL